MCVMMSGGMHTTVLYLLSCCVLIAFIEDVNSLRSSLCSHKSINKIIINKSNRAKLTRNKFNIHQLYDDYVDRETALYEYEKITNRPSRIDYSKDQELSKMLTLGTTMYDDDDDDDDDEDGCNGDEDDSYDEDEVVLMVVIPMMIWWWIDDDDCGYDDDVVVVAEDNFDDGADVCDINLWYLLIHQLIYA